MLLPHKALKLCLLIRWSLMIRVGDHPNDVQPTDISKTLNTQISTSLKLDIVNFPVLLIKEWSLKFS